MATNTDAARAAATDHSPFVREPFLPIPENWDGVYEMLCGHCASKPVCKLVDAMRAYALSGGPWPDNAWVTDPGAGCTCLSYVPKAFKPMSPDLRDALAHASEEQLPHVCGGCAARKGSEASVALHTQRDYRSCVQNRQEFTCHEDPENKRLCGGWCRAVQRKEA